MYKPLLIALICLAFVLNAGAQEKAGFNSGEELEREVTSLLLQKNINDVVKQLDSESPSTVASLLRRLVIYSRAGRSSRVRATLEQLQANSKWECPNDSRLRWLIRNADPDNVRTQRFYHERLCPNDTEGAEAFVRLWSANGDLKEIDAWLAERSDNEEWFRQRLHLRGRSGTAGELLDAFANEIRANPSDWTRLDRYLKANDYAGDLQDLGWLADTFTARTAGEHFELGERVRRSSPQAGAKLLQESLDLPFTDADAKLVDRLINKFRSYAPSVKVNWEKQLRYWTKRGLAEAYQRMNQPLAAQPLIEELVSTKGDDILLGDVHQLAGAVQGGSGQRVVETKILGDEAARRSTSKYWLERATYYNGRAEYGLQRDSYRQALVALAATPADTKALAERYEVVNSFAFFLADGNHANEDQAELEKLLTSELSSVPPQTVYAFQIARLITQSKLDVDELRNSLLAKQPSLLARLLDGSREWSNEQGHFIKAVVNREAVPADLKAKIWSSLEALVNDPGSTRAYFLAEAMRDGDEWQRAIPLWRGYIKHAHPKNWEGYKRDAITNLFHAYCRTKQWQLAEKYLFAEQDLFWRSLPAALAEVALAAAQQSAMDDAMRLWRMSANIDSRNLDLLPQLAQTKLKPQLLAMYSQMKKDDPSSTIPDLALKLLQ